MVHTTVGKNNLNVRQVYPVVQTRTVKMLRMGDCPPGKALELVQIFFKLKPVACWLVLL